MSAGTQPFGSAERSGNAGRPASERVIDAAGARWSLHWAWEDPERPWPGELPSRMRSVWFLRSARDVRSTAATLRRFFRSTWIHGDLAHREDAEVLDVAARHFATGYLRVEPWVAERARSLGGRRTKPADDGKSEAKMDSGGRTELTWVAIELVDEEDKPIPGEDYELTLPDGTVRTGKLDGDGRARERGIDPGNCKVKFPRLDKDAWEFIESVDE